MSKDFDLLLVDVIEEEFVKEKIYQIYSLMLKKFEEFGEGHVNDIDRYVHMLKKDYPSVKLEDYIAIQIAKWVIGDYDIRIWIDCYHVNRLHLMAIFKKALKDSGISQML